MSARKTDSVLGSASVHAHLQTRLTLPTSAVHVRKSGIEFHASHSLPVWKEMTLDLESPRGKKIHCAGVIVSCHGNRQAGYDVSLLFTNISKASLEALSLLSAFPSA